MCRVLRLYEDEARVFVLGGPFPGSFLVFEPVFFKKTYFLFPNGVLGILWSFANGISAPAVNN